MSPEPGGYPPSARSQNLSLRVQRLAKAAFFAALIFAFAVAIKRPDAGTIVYLLGLVAAMALLAFGAPAAAKFKASPVPIAPAFALVFGSLLFALLGAEFALRLFWSEGFRGDDDERTMLYRYDSTLGWFPKENGRGDFTSSRTISFSYNSRGFRDREPVADGKPAIIFLGDSFVWGYDVEASERFTDKLQAKHPERKIYNFGVSGYGTDQEFLLLQQRFSEIKPALVFLVFCTETDEDDNASNIRHGGYKPYYKVDGAGITLSGVPVPHSERAFVADHPLLCRSRLFRLALQAGCEVIAPPQARPGQPTGPLLLALNRFVREKNAEFMVGFTLKNEPLQKLLDEHGVPWVDLSTPLRYPSNGEHWTPEGHTFVCDQIEKAIFQR